jgi:hypothetical protein
MPLPAPTRPTCSHFYKYSKPDHLEWLQPIILEHTLYLPDRTELNDDIDCLPHLSLQSDDEMVLFLLQRFVRDDPSISLAVLDDHERVLRFNIYKNGAATYHPLMVELFDAQLAPFRIYSMTKRPDRMNFWAHYAANHTGYCLEFLHQGPLFESAREVSYLPADQMFIPITDPSISNGDFFFCKTLDWSNEEEVRLVTHRYQGPRVKMNDPRWLNRIILGKDMAEPHRKQIREWAVRRDPVLPVANAYLDLATRTIQLKPA